MQNRVDWLSCLLIIIQRRRVVFVHFIIIALVSWAYAFFIVKKEFKSEIVFLPPISESSLSSVLGISLSSETSSDILPEQIGTIFSSKSLKRRVIDKFNLVDHFKMKKNANKFENTVKKLQDCLVMESIEKGGFGLAKTISFTLRAYHTSPDTAFQMARYSFSLLDSAVKAISADRARRNRIFIESQLDKNKTALDSLQKKMQEFQVANKAYNIPEQVKMSINAYASLKAALVTSEVKMQALKNEFSEKTPELIALQKGIQAYQSNLAKLETSATPDAMPGLSNTAKLLPEYTNLFRDIEVQTQVILLMTRELEQAKIKEDKNVSSLIVTDEPYVPEYKDRPKRILIIATMTGCYIAFIVLFIVFRELYRVQLKDNRFIRSVKDSFLK
jgi:capsule polysaccharide export protein KpsE/RkpR